MPELQVLNDRPYTVQDYLQLNDEQRYELLKGELIMVPRPRPAHQRIALRIAAALHSYLRQNPRGEVLQEVDVHLGEQVVAPDVLFISQERGGIIGELYVQGAPDLVVEVLSPATAALDKKQKSALYWAAGVQEYWLVDPEIKLVEVLLSGPQGWLWAGALDSADVLSTALLPGLQIPLREVFG
ncbi:MAG: Uma2 family endonuclease [Desulfurispora sp.]|uniref:Uma2 family endonuclease n=1 Tax=Desulfurispora sp. TaxID=3014275 RepID=UPI00404A2D22